jgi:uncharacterized protein YndB with AHSA1/START domain
MKVLLWIVGGLIGLVVLCVCALFLMSRSPGAGDTHVAIEIARPPEEVWAWITETAHVKQWVGSLVDVRQDSTGLEGVGARETWIMSDPGMKRPMEIPAVVTAYDKPRSISVHIDAQAMMFTGDLTYTLTPTASGTHLAQDGKWHYADPTARLMVPLITPAANKKGQADFARLKTLIEASPATARE